ncbi:hypothetical protein BC828DRAFT_381455 [Blastocladiella britannica]|nr:hypothetical protein BC828DRAFT_381455 [Blastocladiella britannica]
MVVVVVLLEPLQVGLLLVLALRGNGHFHVPLHGHLHLLHLQLLQVHRVLQLLGRQVRVGGKDLRHHFLGRGRGLARHHRVRGGRHRRFQHRGVLRRGDSRLVGTTARVHAAGGGLAVSAAAYRRCHIGITVGDCSCAGHRRGRVLGSLAVRGQGRRFVGQSAYFHSLLGTWSYWV